MSTLLIAVAAIVSYVCYKLYIMFRVPKELQDLPAISLTATLKSMLKGEQYDTRYNTFYRPVLEKHGVARIWNQGNWEIVLDNPQQIKSILGKADTFLKRTPEEDQGKKMLLRRTIGFETIANSDGDTWRRHRRVANPAFKKAWSVKLFTDCTEELIEKIASYKDEPVIVQDLFQKLTLDALGRGMFSYDFQAIKCGEENYNLKLYSEVMEGAFDPLYLIMPFLENITPSRRHLHRRGQEFRQFLKSIIQKRKEELAAGSDNDDLLSLMIKASDDEKGEASLSDDDVVNDLGAFFIAGHDTTANTLASMFYYLSKHPEIQEKARSEVLSVLGESTEVIAPTIEQLKDMPYLDCIIKETMRCVTTVPQLRRFCIEETELPGGLVVPKNTYLSLQNWGVHHDTGMYKDPDAFKPERFSVSHSPEENQWMAFGHGSRMCIGKNFSLIEQRVALAMTLQKFTFALGPEASHKHSLELSVSGLIHPVNLDVSFTPRI